MDHALEVPAREDVKMMIKCPGCDISASTLMVLDLLWEVPDAHAFVVLTTTGR